MQIMVGLALVMLALVSAADEDIAPAVAWLLAALGITLIATAI